MKNYMPLILSVCLGVAAVLAVSRLLTDNGPELEATTTVVTTSRDLSPGDIIGKGDLMQKQVYRNSCPKTVFVWRQADMLVGQKVAQTIAAGDYIYPLNIELSNTRADIISPGHVGISISIKDSNIGPFLQPGNEIMVFMTSKSAEVTPRPDSLGEVVLHQRTVSHCIFPRLRVLDIEVGDRNPSIMLSLPPDQAIILQRAVDTAEISIYLRPTGDDSNTKREDIPYITDEQTFPDHIKGLELYQVPAVSRQITNQ